jgi:hypothetical protein
MGYHSKTVINHGAGPQEPCVPLFNVDPALMDWDDPDSLYRNVSRDERPDIFAHHLFQQNLPVRSHAPGAGSVTLNRKAFKHLADHRETERFYSDYEEDSAARERHFSPHGTRGSVKGVIKVKNYTSNYEAIRQDRQVNLTEGVVFMSDPLTKREKVRYG